MQRAMIGTQFKAALEQEKIDSFKDCYTKKQDFRFEAYGCEKGINFEIICWQMSSKCFPDKFIWNYYITIKDTQVTKECLAELLSQEDYPGSNLWFHGGATYGNITKSITSYGKTVTEIKVGCDYNHYDDEGTNINFDMVYNDCMQTINDGLADLRLELVKEGDIPKVKPNESTGVI